MKVLVIGSGGREHALVWKLAQSPLVTQLYNNSTNAGMLSLATHVNESSIAGLAAFAAQEQIDLTVVGPEQPLVDGIVDAFVARGLTIFGPTQAAAELDEPIGERRLAVVDVGDDGEVADVLHEHKKGASRCPFAVESLSARNSSGFGGRNPDQFPFNRKGM